MILLFMKNSQMKFLHLWNQKKEKNKLLFLTKKIK